MEIDLSALDREMATRLRSLGFYADPKMKAKEGRYLLGWLFDKLDMSETKKAFTDLKY